MTSDFAAAESTFSTVSRGAEEGSRRGTFDAREKRRGWQGGRQGASLPRKGPQLTHKPGRGGWRFRPGGPRSLFTLRRQLSVPGIGLMPLRTFFFLGYVSFFYRKMQGKRVLQEKSKFPAIISHVLKEIIKVRILAQYVFPKKFNKLILGQFFWHFFFIAFII